MIPRVLMDGVGVVAASHHAVLTRRQAAESGFPSWLLDEMESDGFVVSPTAGVVRATWAPETWRQRAYVATVAAGGDVTLSHRAAAALHSIDGFDEDVVEVTVRKGRRVRVPGVVVHQTTREWDPADLIEIDGIRCTTLARTLVDLPAVANDRRMERALDDFQRRGHSLGWLEATAARLHRPGQRGTGFVLREVERRRGLGRPRDSWFEALVEACIDSPWLPAVTRQHEVRDDRGRFVGRLDLAIPDLRVGIEAHSRRFHTGEHAERMDERRDTALAAEGWLVQYVGWRDTESPATVLRSIEAIVRRRASDLGIRLEHDVRVRRSA